MSGRIAFLLRRLGHAVVMIVGIGTGTFMLREAATEVRLVIGGNTAAINGPAITTALNTPGGIVVAPNGDIYIADTLNYRIRMIDAKTGLIHTVAGNGGPGNDRPTEFKAGEDGHPNLITLKREKD